MILTTTCNAEEFETIRREALKNGLQVTAAPGFIYKKWNWIVGGTLEDEAHFNARIESISLTPHEFLGACLNKEPEPNRSVFIVCENENQRASVIGHFLVKGYAAIDPLMPHGLAVVVVPSEHTVMTAFKYLARENEKEGYATIDFETFKTIAL